MDKIKKEPMKKSLFFSIPTVSLISLVLLSFILLSSCDPPTTPTPPTNKPPEYSVVEKDRFGFNTPWMFGALNNTPPSTASEITEALKKLNQPIIRFPGGTIANSYHFNLPGYNGQQPGATENYIIPFTKIFSPAASPGLAKISFVLNINDHFQHMNYKGTDAQLTDENLQAISYLLDHGFKIPMIEIGNETPLTPELFWTIGNAPLKPIDTVDEHVKILTEIRQTYVNNQAYQEAHFKAGIDKYELIIANYQKKINTLFQSRGLPPVIYGVPIQTIRPGNQYYGDTRHYLRYWNTRARDFKNIHALIPHQYFTFATGNGQAAVAELQGIVREYLLFYPNRKFWFTEFNANPTLNGKGNDDTQEQIDVLNKIIQIFRDNHGDYYFLHQFFTDSSGYPVIYKKITETSKPVNGMVNANGAIVADPQYGKNLFYSPMFCWSSLIRGATAAEYAALKVQYGCK